jgi:hypothetical protein
MRESFAVGHAFRSLRQLWVERTLQAKAAQPIFANLENGSLTSPALSWATPK